MIKHIVLFRFRADVPAATVEELLAELDTFPARYPAMRNWALGGNISTRDTTMTHGFTVEFDTEADLHDYLTSGSHEEFVRERWRPVMDKWVIVSFPVTARQEEEPA
ncbi:Dabb family protein [Micromonospora echinofusca]|uniref:Stress-response A/B barrel domain-containing protein n=1 Tax=Micromonospora echinofusca TaxID=47858 RepID=A0ABS3VUU9_MICEH|nr:Dabb family protein [Micromonospora echinofusca]MBO4208327.1 hypothetical protein [Micromonospora echinofusca]